MPDNQRHTDYGQPCGFPGRFGLEFDASELQHAVEGTMTRRKTKLWHDDIRRPPDDSWIWARTNEDARLALMAHRIEECSLDHDLGLHLADPDVQDADLQRGWDQENDGYTLVQWMCEHPELVPQRILIHSWNPPGAARMAALLADHGFPCIVRPYAREVAL